MRECGVYLNRGRIINTVLYEPLVFKLFTSLKFHALYGADEKVIDYAFEFIIVSLPGVYFITMFDLKKRFLNCMRVP